MSNTSGRVFRRVRHSSAIVDAALAGAWARRIFEEGEAQVGVSYDINNGTITGRLLQDPQLKNTPSGMSVCEFIICCNEEKNRNGQRSMELHEIPVVAFGAQADVIARSMRAGDGIIATVKLSSRAKEAKDGRIFRDVSVYIQKFSMCSFTNKPEGRDPEYGDRYEGSPNDRGPNNQRNIGREGWNGGGGGQTAMGGDEDIPFAPSMI